MLTDRVGKQFQHIQQPGIQSQAAAVVVTMDTDMDTSLGDRLVSTLIPNNVQRGWHTSFNFIQLSRKQKKY